MSTDFSSCIAIMAHCMREEQEKPNHQGQSSEARP